MSKLKTLLDEAHEQAALGLFLTGLGLELFTPFDDKATVAVFFLAAVTLLGSKRFQGFSPTSGPTLVPRDDSDLEDDTE
jgi:hypothetical protein